MYDFFGFPEADIPVMQLGINRNLSLKEHFEFGSRLGGLRDHGIMIIVGGNIIYNLGEVDPDEAAKPYVWAKAFDTYIKESPFKP